MARRTEARVIIHLACPQCKERTYTTTKNRRSDSQRMELSKYCPRCRVHTAHREVR